LQHTRHRSPKGFLINTVAALTAYQFLDKKPSLKIVPEKNDCKQLLIAA
ncbi:MAG: IS982 family transposase, partial [Verrucomicrobia bacterium]|nr:IS982 family transposase [Verrucomicrobiota bacterium]